MARRLGSMCSGRSTLLPLTRKETGSICRCWVVVPAETRYLKGLGEDLSCLFYLASMVDNGCDLDPGRTVYLTMHGSVDVSEDDQIMAGSPSLPSLDPDRWISLDQASVATLVRWVRGPEDQRPSAVVNTGCFPSSRRRYKSTTFNEELAGLLVEEGITVYGPPYGGIVTSATWLVHLRGFGQRLEDGRTIRNVPIKLQKIAPAGHRPRRKSQVVRRGTKLHGSLVVTNEHDLAREVCTFSPDFAEPRPHNFDRTLME